MCQEYYQNQCTHTEGFSFLNESRKKQFIKLLKEADALPVYCVGDDEICFRAGYLNDGTMLAAIYELGIDPLDSLTLYLKEKPESMVMLKSDGEEAPVRFEPIGNDMYMVHVRVECLNPVILLIR